MSTRLRLIGVGPGDPDLLTHQAASALAGCDAVLLIDKQRGVDDLNDVRAAILDRFAHPGVRRVTVLDPDRDRRADHTAASYRDAVQEWHAARAERYLQALGDIGPGHTVGILVWGDPAFYDSTIRIVEQVQAAAPWPVEYDVLPGISSIQLLAAGHRLVLHRIGEPITITTGRRLIEQAEAGLDNLVVMLDGELTCLKLPAEEWSLWYGVNLGTPSQRLVRGRLAEISQDVVQARDQAKAERGWAMDVYLLRRA